MPHDNAGQPLKVGDLVMIPCRVKDIYSTDEYCNVELETLYPMHPSSHHSGITLNAKQVSLVPTLAETGPVIRVSGASHSHGGRPCFDDVVRHAFGLDLGTEGGDKSAER